LTFSASEADAALAAALANPALTLAFANNGEHREAESTMNQPSLIATGESRWRFAGR
jgi:hypothetical protein